MSSGRIPRVLAFLLASLLLPASALPVAQIKNFDGFVTNVISGDTILVKTLSPSDPVTYRVRLYDVHAPFSGDGVRPSQPDADLAKYFLEKKLAGKRVRVLTGKGLQFDPVLGLVFVDKQCINEYVLREGWAWYRANSGYRDARFDDDVDTRLRRASEEAREKRIGLWRHSNPQSPWDYREETKGMKATKRIRRICPYCNSMRVLPIVYGYLMMDKVGGKKPFVPGGCVVDSRNPDWKCKDCEHEW